MNASRFTTWSGALLIACGLSALTAATGCQSTVGGQTLPSAYYIEDDIQYFPAGPEFLLPNTARALEEHRLQQQAGGGGGQPGGGGPAGGGQPPMGGGQPGGQ